MASGTIHIIGAGLAGLSAATTLAEKGLHVVLYEASAQAGGRCRSYHDAALGMSIDNGNHLLLSGNHAAKNYLTRIGSHGLFARRGEATFDYIDAPSLQRWTLRMNKGPIPWWIFNKVHRVPDTTPQDYLGILGLLGATPAQSILARIKGDTMLYKRLWHSFLVSALNTHPREASAKLATAIIRGSVLRGGGACVPLVAHGLSAAFIDPALKFITVRGGIIHYQRRLTAITFTGNRATHLGFSTGEPVMLGPNDSLICAMPPSNMESLLPGIKLPNEWRGILNAHFAIMPPAGWPKLMGVIGAMTEWIFAFENRISITVSDADRMMDENREVLAAQIWAEVSRITGLAATLPPWQIVKEKRATFAATPAQDKKRPHAKTPWTNLLLAGDWTQTGLPATIEGAVRSGEVAAKLILGMAK